MTALVVFLIAVGLFCIWRAKANYDQSFFRGCGSGFFWMVIIIAVIVGLVGGWWAGEIVWPR
jgi:hypothetical protein